jgi:hypothetical protein
MVSVWVTERRLLLVGATHTSRLEVNKVHKFCIKKNFKSSKPITDTFKFTSFQRSRQNLLILKEIVCLISVMFCRLTLLLFEDDILIFF